MKDMPVLQLITIDLSDLNNTNEVTNHVEDIRAACEGPGFFYLKPSCSIQAQMESMIDNVKSFFALPLDQKMELLNDESTQIYIHGRPINGTGAGYRPTGGDPNFQKDSRESFNIGSESLGCCDTEEIRRKQLSGSGINKWPAEERLPGWRRKVNCFIKDVLDLSKVLSQLIALSLNLPRNYFEQPGWFDKATWVLGMVHYLPQKSIVEEDRFGIRPHSDGGIFTLLVTDGQPGLEICLDKTAHVDERIWLPVPKPPAGSFIVNLGKNLEYISGNRLKATLHRVVNTTGDERFSMPFFYETNSDTKLRPLVESGLQHKDHVRDAYKNPAEFFLERLQTNKDATFE